MSLFHQHIHDVTPKQWTYIGDEIFIPMRPELYSALGDIVSGTYNSIQSPCCKLKNDV